MKYSTEEIIRGCEFAGMTEFETENLIMSLPKKRTNQQNRALHLYCAKLAKALNEQGHTFNYEGISGKTFETPWTLELIKEMIWKPIQRELFGDNSTTKLTTDKINSILNILSKWLGENMHIYVQFPCFDNKYEEYGKTY